MSKEQDAAKSSFSTQKEAGSSFGILTSQVKVGTALSKEGTQGEATEDHSCAQESSWDDAEWRERTR